MKILICEDELIVAEYIKETCVEQGLTVVGVAKNREEAILLIAIEKPNIVLLDINLEERFSGIKIAEYILKSGLDISFIFITAFSDKETLDAAFSKNPEGYLVKPIDKSTLIANLLLTIYKVNNKKERVQSKVFSLETESGVRSIDVSQLLYVGSDGNYCDFFFENGSKVTERVSISVVSETFESDLIRTHKSFSINPYFTVRFTSIKVFMKDGSEIPIGRKFKENIADYLGGAK